MTMETSGDLWWVPDEQDVWTLATESSGLMPNGCVSYLVLKSRKLVALPKEKCYPAYKDQGNPEDLIFLPSVNPASILECTRVRFAEQKIYTSMGMVLMSVNPFRVIPGLYGKKVIAKYEDPMDRNLPAHVYLVPSRAYHSMCSSGKDQSILISGESGAGKTEATKQCLSFLTEVANNAAASKRRGSQVGNLAEETSKSAVAEIADRIIAASPILEAFGNAQTVRNPNSSRFGKWMVLQFDRNNSILSSNIISYLLEKSRVTQRDPKERNYHIFYQILRGVGHEQLRLWQVNPSTAVHRYTAGEGNSEAPDFDDARTFHETRQALLRMGFSDEEAMNLFKIVIGVLQLGDVQFVATKDGEGSEISNPEIVEQIAKKLSIAADTMTVALVNRSIESGKNKRSLINIQLNLQKALESRDTLARSIYEKIFLDVIQRINAKSQTTPGAVAPDRNIGLLDIFGFEIFTENSFEQLCINYCNEMLQNHFNYVIFTAEKALYDAEAIHCETIEFRDNIDVIREVEHMFRALDEEAKVVKGTSKTWFEKLKRGVRMQNVSFPTRRTGDIFSVKHYAGSVDYNAANFLEKNVETVNNDLVATMSSSTDPLIFRMFAPVEPPPPPPTPAGHGEGKKESALHRTKSSGALVNKSLSWRFISQLNTLMNMLKKTQSHFIRCVKSNDACRPQLFENTVVYKQLIYSGVFEVVKIQQSGLPCRMPHFDFVQRYRCLAPSQVRYGIFGSGELIAQLNRMGYDLTMARVGRNLTFYKSQEQRVLESRRDQLLKDSSTRISRFLRMKSRHYVYCQLLSHYREFQSWNEALVFAEASRCFDLVCHYCEDMHRLVRFGILQHVMQRLERELGFLDRRVQLVADAERQLQVPGKEGVDGLEDIIVRALDLELTTHQVIKRCRDVIQHYYQALEFVSMVQITQQKGNKFRRASVGSNTLNTLSKEQIEDGIQLIQQMAHLIDDADGALRAAEQYHAAVQDETEMKLTPLLACQSRCKARFDARTGNLVFRLGEEGQKAFEHLKHLVEELEPQECKSADLSDAFEDCQSFIFLMEEFVAINDAFNGLIFMKESSCSREGNRIFQDQMADFQKWAEVQTSSLALRQLLQKNFVPGFADENGVQVVAYSELEALLLKLRVLDEPSMLVQGVLRAGDWVLKMRKAYLEKDWERLEHLVNDADDDGVKNGIFYEYPECVEELNNCQWQVIYHGFYQDMLFTLSESVFRSIPLDLESWTTMVASIHDGVALVDEVKNFADGEKYPKLLELLPLVEKILQLRSLVYSKDVDYALLLIEDMLKQEQDVLDRYEVGAIVREEIECCKRLIARTQYEWRLETYLKNKPAIDYGDIDHVDANQQFVFARLYNLTESITNLQNVLQAFQGLHASFAATLQARITVGNVLLSGRKYLQMPDEGIMSYNSAAMKTPWEEYLRSYKSGMQSVIETSPTVFAEFEEEYDTVCKELGRRQVLRGFCRLLSRSLIVGDVDNNPSVPESSLTECFHEFNALVKMVKDFFGVAVPANVQAVVKFTRQYLQLIKEMTTSTVWNHGAIVSHLSVLKGMKHGEASNHPIVMKELQLLEAEITARNCADKMRQELENVKMSFTAEPSVVDAAGGSRPEQKRVFVDLQPLQQAIVAMEKHNPGRKSKPLLSVAKKVVSLIEALLKNETEHISFDTMDSVVKELIDLQLNPQTVEKVFDRIRINNFLRSLAEILERHRTSPTELFTQVEAMKSSMKQLPVDFYVWLRAAYLFCGVCDAVTGKDWVVIVDACQRLDYFLQQDVEQAFAKLKQEHSTQLEARRSLASETWQQDQQDYSDAVRFMQACAEQKLFGYQLALELKQQEDEVLEQQRVQNFTPTEALKARIREEELLSNAYGVGQLRSAGFSDLDIAKQRFPVKVLWAYNFDASLLHSLGYPAKALLHAGYSIADLYRAAYTATDLIHTGVPISELVALGITVGQLRQAGISEEELLRHRILGLSEVKAIEYHPSTLHRLGFSLEELIEAGFSARDLRGAGFNAVQIFNAGIHNVQAFIEAGFALEPLTSIFPLDVLKQTNRFTFAEYVAIGLSLTELIEAGFEEEVERIALVALFQAANGSQWRIKTNWSMKAPLSSWFGVAVKPDRLGKERVVGVDLVNNNLRGHVPPELCHLRCLKRLHLALNQLSTSVPDTVVDLIVNNDVATDLPIDPQELAMARQHSPIGRSRHSFPLSIKTPVLDWSPTPLRSSLSPYLNNAMKLSLGARSHGQSVTEMNSTQEEERSILMEFFHALKGKKWKQNAGWGSAQSVKEWYGVSINRQGFVTAIKLPSNNLRGFIPNSIGGLSMLETLDLRLNQISGIIPEGIGLCCRLMNVHLQTNKLSCTIPDVFHSLSQLTVLDLRSNLLQGELPASISLLSQLRYLGLRSNLVIVADLAHLSSCLPLCKIVH